MLYGYTIADRADADTFQEAAEFVAESLHYVPTGDALEDVDGSLFQKFRKDGNVLRLESQRQIDYVAIISDVELPIDCLERWTKD